MDWIKRHKLILSVTILFFSALLYSAGLNNLLPIINNEDAAIYIMMAKTLIPTQAPLYNDPQIKPLLSNYPYGYPAMLSFLLYFFPGNYFILKILSLVFTLLLIFFLFYMVKFFFKDTLAVMVIPLIALSPQIVYYSAKIISEAAYIFFTILAVYFLQSYTEKRPSNRILYLIIGILASIISYYIRLVGIAIIVSIPVLFLFKKEFKKAVICFIGLAMLAGLWAVFNILLHRLPYVTEFFFRTGSFGDFIHRWFYNLVATVGKELPDLFSYPFLANIDPYEPAFAFKFAIGCLLAFLMTVGFILKIKKEGLSLIDVYSAVYFFIFYLSWTHHGGRYMMPILVFMTYYLILGIKRFFPQKKLLYGIISFLILLNIAGDIRWLVGQRRSPLLPVEKSFMAAGDWIKRNTTLDSIIVSRRPSWLRLYADGRRSLTFLRTKDTKNQYEYVRGNKVDYIIIDEGKIYRDSARDYLVPLVKDYQDIFQEVYVTEIDPKTYIYKVKK